MGALFCHKCGTKMGVTNPAPQYTPQPNPQAMPYGIDPRALQNPNTVTGYPMPQGAAMPHGYMPPQAGFIQHPQQNIMPQAVPVPVPAQPPVPNNTIYPDYQVAPPEPAAPPKKENETPPVDLANYEFFPFQPDIPNTVTSKDETVTNSEYTFFPTAPAPPADVKPAEPPATNNTNILPLPPTETPKPTEHWPQPQNPTPGYQTQPDNPPQAYYTPPENPAPVYQAPPVTPMPAEYWPQTQDNTTYTPHPYTDPNTPTNQWQQFPNMQVNNIQAPDSSAYQHVQPASPATHWPPPVTPETDWPQLPEKLAFFEQQPEYKESIAQFPDSLAFEESITYEPPKPKALIPTITSDFSDFFTQPPTTTNASSFFDDEFEIPSLTGQAPLPLFADNHALANDELPPPIRPKPIATNKQQAEPLDLAEYLDNPTAPLPWFAENNEPAEVKQSKPSPIPKPLPANAMPAHSPKPRPNKKTTAPNEAEFFMSEPKFDDPELDDPDFIESKPKKKGKIITFILCFVLFIAVGLVGAYYVTDGEIVDLVLDPGARVVGTWEEFVPMGTWVSRYVFNADGTGKSLQYNNVHGVTQYEQYFNWHVERRTRLILTDNYGAILQDVRFSFETRSGALALRLRYDEHGPWSEFWRIE